MIVYMSDPINSTRELLILINNFSKVAGNKINSKKLVAFIYTKDEWAEKEIKEATLVTIVTNNINYLGVTLPKHMKDALTKNNLQIQCNPHQNSNSILYRDRKGSYQIIWNNKSKNKTKQTKNQ